MIWYGEFTLQVNTVCLYVSSYLCKVKLIIVSAVVLAFIIVASSNNDVHSNHTQDEHVKHRGPHQLLWKQVLNHNPNFAHKSIEEYTKIDVEEASKVFLKTSGIRITQPLQSAWTFQSPLMFVQSKVTTQQLCPCARKQIKGKHK